MANKNYIELSNEELQNVNGGKGWWNVWKGIDGIISPLQSTPSWVQGKTPVIKPAPYTPGGHGY
jgi:bacteriocin-like protein